MAGAGEPPLARFVDNSTVKSRLLRGRWPRPRPRDRPPNRAVVRASHPLAGAIEPVAAVPDSTGAWPRNNARGVLPDEGSGVLPGDGALLGECIGLVMRVVRAAGDPRAAPGESPVFNARPAAAYLARRHRRQYRCTFMYRASNPIDTTDESESSARRGVVSQCTYQHTHENGWKEDEHCHDNSAQCLSELRFLPVEQRRQLCTWHMHVVRAPNNTTECVSLLQGACRLAPTHRDAKRRHQTERFEAVELL